MSMLKYKRMYRFLYTYKQCKKDFVRPKFHWYFGPWKNEPNLPIWRRGNLIKLGGYNQYDWETNTWNDIGKKKHPILSRIFKPTYELPLWLSFYLFNWDITYKTKWREDDYRYEFPGHLTLVLFGWAISVTASVPKSLDDHTWEDDYWESMLTYQHYNGDLKKVNDVMGYYNDVLDDSFRFCFRPEFLKDPNKQSELAKIQIDTINELYQQHLPIKFVTIETEINCGDKTESFLTTYKGINMICDNVDDANDIHKLLKSIKIRNKKVSYVIRHYCFLTKDEFNEFIKNKPTKEVYKSAIIDKEKFNIYVC